MKKLFIIAITATYLLACNKNKNTTPSNNNSGGGQAPLGYPISTSNHFAATVNGTVVMDTLVGGMYEDNYILLNGGNSGITKKAFTTGTYTMTTMGSNGIENIVIGANSTYYSVSTATMFISVLDTNNTKFGGTFKGIFFDQSNPTQTVSVTGGSFYFKLF